MPMNGLYSRIHHATLSYKDVAVKGRHRLIPYDLPYASINLTWCWCRKIHIVGTWYADHQSSQFYNMKFITWLVSYVTIRLFLQLYSAVVKFDILSSKQNPHNNVLSAAQVWYHWLFFRTHQRKKLSILIIVSNIMLPPQ